MIGPAAPTGTISFERYRYDPLGPYLVPEGDPVPGFEFSAGDSDGVLSAVTVNWGDGSPTASITNSAVPGCYLYNGVYAGLVYLPSYCIYQADHTYAGPGTYKVTLTVVSGARTRNP